MDNQPQLSEQQQQALNELLERAAAFEELVRTRGWEYIQAYYENKVKELANRILNETDKPIAEFEGARNELIGLKKMLGEISTALQTLQNERSKQPTN